MTNPFDPVAEFPDFPAMTPAAAEAALPVLLAGAERRIDALEKEAPCTWEGVVTSLEEATRPLWEAWGAISHLLSVCNSDAWRALEEKWQPRLVAFSLRVGQSRVFYARAKELLARLGGDAPPVRRRILEKMVQGAELCGVSLEGDEKERFNAIEAALAKCSADFRDHVLDATKAFRLPLAEESLKGLPPQVREAVRTPQGYAATIEDALYVPFMKHCADRAVREKLYRARCTRASRGETDNTPLIARILDLRRQRAALLGYADYAHLSLATKCAPSVAAVFGMIDELAAAARPAAKREKAELAAFAAGLAEAGDGNGDLAPWDVAYYAERQREKNYAYSEEELSAYFNFPAVLDGLFSLAGRLFDIAIEPADGQAPVWHADVRFFRVKEKKDGTVLAHFYLDPYSRPATKQGGAWMNELRTRARRADGTLQLPLALICCNQPPCDRRGRCCMTFREVETLFHEFGHALQHMLTQVDEPGASGLNLIDWDAVEVASQFMENWCVHAVCVSRFARHVETQAPIPRTLLDKVRAARCYRAGHDTLRQLAFAKMDMMLHVKDFAGDPNDLKKRIFSGYDLPALPEDRFLNAFTHIFSGGYAAGYYGYKWSEVMSADVFGAFEEAGLDRDQALRSMGARLRETFLSLGGSCDPMEVFRRFRGRAPAIDALLRHQGLKKDPQER